MKKFVNLLLCLFILVICSEAEAEAQDSIVKKGMNLPDQLFRKINAKSEHINARIISQTDKYLARMASEERVLYRKLLLTDSADAVKIFGDAQAQYSALQQKIQNVSGKTKSLKGKYIPHLDSLQTALRFLQTAGDVNSTVGNTPLIKEALSNLSILQAKLDETEEIKQFLKYRSEYLQEQLRGYGFTKNITNIKRQVYYYQAQVEEYKRAFDHPSVLERKALVLLKKTELFKEFFRKHSQYARLFNLSESAEGSSNPLAEFASLQTREGVDQQLLNRFGSSPDLQRMTGNPVDGSSTRFSQFKDQLARMASGGNEKEMPDFKPNNQKTKSFKNRLELGANLQTVKSTRFFPSTTDLALSVGYKLNDKSLVGLGGSYKMGWGKNARHISISHQGIGVRSFMDMKIRSGFWLTGGAEMNYRSQFSNFEILDDYTPWQKSALIGLSKKYRVSKKVKGNAQLLYDFLHKQQVPKTQAVLFRVGYSF